MPELYDRLVLPDPRPELADVPPCIVCGETRARTAYRVEGVEAPIVVCAGCGLGLYHPMPDYDEIASFYPADYYGEPGKKFRPFIESLVRVVGQRHVAFLSRNLSKGARVLDIGCGRGVLLGRLMDMGFEAHGVELNEDAARGADPRAEIRFATHLRDAAYPEDFFDEIILWHVLEHLPDPRGTLEECRRIMKPGGKIIVSLPNFGSLQSRVSGAAWFHLDPPRHLFHFPAKALARLLERCDFACESVHHFSLRQNPFGWIQSALNRFSGLPRNALYTYLYQADPSSRPELGHLTRLGMWAFFVVSSPFALAFSILMAAVRDGATVHIVAHRKS